MSNIERLRHIIVEEKREYFRKILQSAKINISEDEADIACSIMCDLFDLNPDGTIKKPPKDFTDDYGCHILLNIMPGVGITSHKTDTLLVHCVGNDRLDIRFTDMLSVVGARGYSNVIFYTTKWDNAVVTGSNIQRLDSLIELLKRGTGFCFILGCTAEPVEITLI